jgi:hypothetical protein
MRNMTESQARSENVDTPAEISWGKKMSNQRNAFLRKLMDSAEHYNQAKTLPREFVSGELKSNLFISSSFSLILQQKLIPITQPTTHIDHPDVGLKHLSKTDLCIMFHNLSHILGKLNPRKVRDLTTYSTRRT